MYFISYNEGCVCKTLPFRFSGTFVCWASLLSKVPVQGVGRQAPPQNFCVQKKRVHRAMRPKHKGTGAKKASDPITGTRFYRFRVNINIRR